ncbi:TPA: methyltransferase domain-containing protein [Cronobacter sakazakii]|uniref:bifunctional class I SAM-dependent methyltransferase/glycosyltransferase n=1 Tax=Cronobacter sakazakii TaxID=28141 RepID=UPI0013759C11|nr:bifunctional class I SAM-dependent methyltransferase/glycosyltransferase [Cronobacter sakazakii]NCH08236.1 methyltransferase domain-containing protein [Cronobacter sakazakii]HAU5437088.1 methyltransferase domain-containing protein [Cronobacter sakazakii]HDK7239455.1 methyltransferase regulatory domain-containing protein [Cronobacter sakazakii]HDK7255553.1 methyltransferase regulatory domain-containing protein [Cronobacter sakazakii]HDK7325427.1 methyltransferase regulatory domain-containing
MNDVKTLYPEHRISPVALHASAALNHVAAASPAFARVLEIGCGAGEALIAHARAWPNSIALGIDLDEARIGEGQQQIQASGLTNIELFAAGLGDLLAVSPGEFDYIIIHGRFSHTDDDTRDALLRWCRQHLSAQGIIAYHAVALSDNEDETTLRNALAFHSQRAANEAEQLNCARAMLGYLAMTLPDGALKTRVLAAEALDDASLMQRFLADDTAARNYTDFARDMQALDLACIGDALPQTDLAACYGERQQQLHAMIAGQSDRHSARQYLDFAVNRRERFTMLCAKDAAEPSFVPDLAMLESLHWAGNFTRVFTINGKVVSGHISQSGVPVRTENPVTLQILDVLAGAWPMSLSVEQLIFNCRLPERPGDDTRKLVLESLRDLFLNNLDGLFWSAMPGPYNLAQNDVLAPVVPLPMTDEESRVLNLWGEAVIVAPARWRWLGDGMRTTDDEAWASFTALRIRGVLQGTPLAWKNAIQPFLRTGNVAWLKQCLNTLLLLSVSERRGGLLQSEANMDADSQTDSIHMDAVYEEANRLIVKGMAKEAREYTRALLEDDSQNMHILRCYSHTCVLTGAWDEALEALCRLMGYYFSSLDIYDDLATALHETLDRFNALKVMRSLLRLDEKNGGFWNSLGTFYHARGDMTLAEKCTREAFRLQPRNPRYLAMMGVVLSDNQKLDEARYFLEKSLELAPQDFGNFTSLLFVMTHDNRVSAQELLAKHHEYGERVTAAAALSALELPLNNVKDPNRKLRVGFVSGDLRTHPVSNFLLPFWDSFDRTQFELVGYNAAPIKDEVTDHLRAGAVLWRDVYQLSDRELARQINDDGVDILIDLSGHTTWTRLPMFALRPAPLQMTWIGYPGTTGVPAMDYRVISSTLASPPGLAEQFTEQILWVPMRKIFEPHPQSPDVNMLPALRNGHLTFASFNRPKKINDEVLELWAQILVRAPSAKLLMGFMADDEMIAMMARQLTRFGARPEQLIFKTRTGLIEYLEYHHHIDILLDAFPYTGGTTTNHGAWMGVPTLTLCGETMAGRQGVETMNGYGLPEFVANDKADYVEKALSWQGRFEELNAIRLSMRSRIPTDNADGFRVADTFEKGLREAWKIYCTGEAPRSFFVEE